jgi:GAF domain-containing protein
VKPPLPPREAERLAALRRYEILDTPPERALDDITGLAAHICSAPTALITFIDSERQWFKSRYGWEDSESSREISFCAHAIVAADGGELVVTDASQDPRFRDNPYVTANPPLVCFYAGVPLLTPDGHALGTLCVIDRRPRVLSPEQVEALRALRRTVVDHLELRRLQAEMRLLIEAQTRDDIRIDLSEKDDTAYWSRKLAVSGDELSSAIAQVGALARNVKAYLRQRSQDQRP